MAEKATRLERLSGFQDALTQMVSEEGAATVVRLIASAIEVAKAHDTERDELFSEVTRILDQRDTARKTVGELMTDLDTARREHAARFVENSAWREMVKELGVSPDDLIDHVRIPRYMAEIVRNRLGKDFKTKERHAQIRRLVDREVEKERAAQEDDSGKKHNGEFEFAEIPKTPDLVFLSVHGRRSPAKVEVGAEVMSFVRWKDSDTLVVRNNEGAEKAYVVGPGFDSGECVILTTDLVLAWEDV